MPELTVLYGCRTIQLPHGMNALIDEDAFGLVGGVKWHGRFNGYAWYVVRNIRIPGGDRSAFRTDTLHRVLMDNPPGMHVDHKNGDTLDNRRENLRLSTSAENKRNQRRSRGRSKFKGVSPSHSRWVAGIRVDTKRLHLGYFDTEEAAARAYDIAAEELHGEFACTNKDLFGDY